MAIKGGIGFYTVGELGKRFGVPTWKISRLAFIKKMPEPEVRRAKFRLWSDAQLPAIEAALRNAGVLPAASEVPQ